MSKLNFNFQSQSAKKTPKPVARTENGALAYATTGSIYIDFFSKFGAMRNSSPLAIKELFYKLFNENGLDAVKLLAFFRDCRGGQGEKKVFQVIMQDFIMNDNPLAYQLTPFVPEFGSWKDIRELMTFAATNKREYFVQYASRVMIEQLLVDINAQNMSLCAKWVPTENWSRNNKTNRKVFNVFIAEAISMLPVNSEREYRQLISAMRESLKVVERQMSLQEWGEIDFASVPSKAHTLYRKAFGKHQQSRYAEYLAQVKSGAKKINASVSTPVDILEKYCSTNGHVYAYDETLEQQWKALPKYCRHDVLAISDTSGSMYGKPMLISIALGIYFAQQSTGMFKNELVNFDSKPRFYDLSKAKTLREAITIVSSMEWGGSTDFVAVFTKLLEAAKRNKAKQEDLPKFLICISDMQFNTANGSSRTPFSEVKKMFKNAGYEMPQFIFWNVDSRDSDNFPAFDEFGVMQVSGSSPAVLQYVLSTLGSNTMEIVQRVLDNPRYAFVDDLEFFKM